MSGGRSGQQFVLEGELSHQFAAGVGDVDHLLEKELEQLGGEMGLHHRVLSHESVLLLGLFGIILMSNEVTDFQLTKESA